ncbi:MAG: cyanophycin synthetase, partial [Planctomycetota bacterium]
VFGCGGDRDTTKRPVMGAIAARLADRVVLTSDNPRSEKPSAIISEIIAGMPAKARESVIVHAERERAIEHAIIDASPGDVVVIAGKGHERTQVSAEGSRAFDDRDHARQALAMRASEVAKA